MTTWRFPISLLCLAAAAVAQDPVPAKPANGATSAAEQQFRDAWWAESGRNDVDAALRGYLAAAAADGPASIRARANLFAGRLQQRQGQTEQALASFRRVVNDFANETESATAARTHLQELTAVDLRKNYDEWYERRLFSEEVQLAILAKIDQLTALVAAPPTSDRTPEEKSARTAHEARVNTVRAEIVAYGKGAVPALRKAALGRQQALAAQAIDLLFELDEMPPAEALMRHSEWANDAQQWQRVLEQRFDGAVPATTGEWHGALFAAALRGPGAATSSAMQQMGAACEAMRPLLVALLHFPEPRQKLLAALGDQATPLATRDAIDESLRSLEDKPVLTCAEWLLASADPLRDDLQRQAFQRVGWELRQGHANVFDDALRRLGDEQTFGDDRVRREAGAMFVQGLEINPVAELLPWTPERLQVVLGFAFAGDCSIHDVLVRLRRNDATRAMVAAALLAEPSVLHARLRREDAPDDNAGRLRAHFGDYEPSETAAVAFRRQWQTALVVAAKASWPRYSDVQRLDALVLLDGATNPDQGRSVLREFLQQQVDGASESVKTELQALVERCAK